ncbi:MAG: hypothetical protein U9N77_00250 [Thermodesulfobacteriota bacterium]|nr:hypothetical protein [Thermodesulfobacteriota bacterium]
MNQPESEREDRHNNPPKIIFRIIICIIILAAGFAAMKYFSSAKKHPHMVHKKEHAIEVKVKKALPEDIEICLTGFGVVEPVKSVTISSEVSGSIIWTNPCFKAGEVIAKGEMLFKIDPVNYEVTKTKAETVVMERKKALHRLKKEFESDRKRIKTITRTRELARAEYQRVQKLFKNKNVGNMSGVDKAEQTFNNAKDQADQLEIKLDLYPISIKEAAIRLGAAKADLLRADADLTRCTVAAPFQCRIKSVVLEKGEFAGTGKEILTIADDSLLEIKVALDAKKAAAWLKFQEPDSTTDTNANNGWFAKPVPVKCQVLWTERQKSTPFKGFLHRIVTFDQTSRTMTAAVRIDTREFKTFNKRGCPLVEGMFCSVKIPGKTVKNLYRVPTWAVTTENTIYITEEMRLKTRHITKAYSEEESIFISKGIKEGDTIITTRLVDPMENALVKFRELE